MIGKRIEEIIGLGCLGVERLKMQEERRVLTCLFLHSQ